jgi:uncharacterized membrane protein YgdD (TMEM256/DUF423 family)
MNGRTWLILGAIVAGLAVGFGAMGAHWFEGRAAELYADEALRARRMEIWHTAAQYQMYHGLAVIAVGLLSLHHRSRCKNAAAIVFLLGTILFSGSLYLIASSGAINLRELPSGIPLIIATPVGGTCLIIGWIIFTIGAWKLPRSAPIEKQP